MLPGVGGHQLHVLGGQCRPQRRKAMSCHAGFQHIQSVKAMSCWISPLSVTQTTLSHSGTSVASALLAAGLAWHTLAPRKGHSSPEQCQKGSVAICQWPDALAPCRHVLLSMLPARAVLLLS